MNFYMPYSSFYVTTNNLARARRLPDNTTEKQAGIEILNRQQRELKLKESKIGNRFRVLNPQV
jgi:hypothetical protein